jgi:hypothetical protein
MVDRREEHATERDDEEDGHGGGHASSIGTL